MQTRDLKKKAIELRVEALQAIHDAGIGHSGASASSAEILTSLYYGVLSDGPLMQFNSANPGWSEQDYFVLSKYTAAPLLYAVLADVAFFDKSELENFCKPNALLQAIPSKRVPGVHASVASPGHGLSVALGIAFALRMEKRTNRVFCLVEDRELQNGQVWEAVMAAAHHKMDNLTLVLEMSGVQTDGLIRGVMNVDPVAEKFRAFGWKAIRVQDGHDFDQLLNAFDSAVRVKRQPKVLLAKTKTSNGVPFAEGKFNYYGATLSKPEMKEFLDYSEMAWKKL